MKTAIRLLVAAALAAAPVSAQVERERGGGRGESSKPSAAPAPARSAPPAPLRTAPPAPMRPAPSHQQVIIKQRRVPVPEQPRPFERPEHIVREPRPAPPPARDDRGQPITRRRMLPPSRDAAVARNKTVVNEITRLQRVEVVPDQTAWHVVDGVRFCHFFDGRVHWWGFFDGPTFFWSRFWFDRWWWWDPVFARWVFWWDGFWWWPGPAGAMFVFVDNDYYPYAPGGVTVSQPYVEQPAPAAPATTDLGSSFTSPDGRRLVQIYGDRAEAFLYDTTGGSPAFLSFLASDVEKARFSGGAGGEPLLILLDLKDGSFALYDEDGRPSAGAAAPAKKAKKAKQSRLPSQAPPHLPPPPAGETAPPADAPSSTP